MSWSFPLCPMQPLTADLNKVRCVMGEWIPVTERLPERPDTVVVADADSVDCGWYYNGVWSWSSDLAACNPTHWMPLPAHPEEA